MKRASGYLLLSTGLAVGLTACDLLPKRSLGEQVWRKRCAECHGLDGAGNTPRYMGQPYADLLDDSWNYGSDEVAIESAIRDGILGKMPPSPELSRDEVRAVMEYLKELRRNR
ncbi:MAG: c-type cytochrome [Acidobacteriota bacterium]